MKINLKNISIRDRIYTLIFLFLFSAVVSAFTLNYFQRQSSKFHTQLSAIHLMGEQIMDLNESCNTIFSRNIFDIRDKIQTQKEAISGIIKSITTGGYINGFENQIKPLSIEVEENLEEVNKAWDLCLTNLIPIFDLPQKMDSSFYEQREIALNDSISQNIQIERVVLVDNIEMKKAIVVISSSFKEVNGSIKNLIMVLGNQLNYSYKLYTLVFIALGILNIGIFIFSFFWIRNNVVTPIKSVGQQANLVANGNLNTTIEYDKEDEIGTISSAINSMANYLRNASKFVHQIGDGNLDSRFEGIKSDEINEGSLAHALISMKQKLRSVASEDDKRNWATRGVAQFADIIRKNNNNLNELSSAIMSSLVQYTNTTQGCIYIHEKDKDGKEFLSLNAFYAFDTAKFFKDKLMLGEGIVGQTFLEKKTTYMVEVPENYMLLKSGLGNMDPLALLVVPITINNEAYGVIELATFNEIEKYKIEFIEQLGEMIASAIANVRNNEQTQSLLEESQQLAEQMKSQEEEMRQNMEELSATQEEMARKEKQTQGIISAIDNSFATAELSMNGEVFIANKRFAEFCGFSLSKDIIGINIKDLVKQLNGSSASPFWDELSQGNSINKSAIIASNTVQISMTPTKTTGNDYDKVLLFAQTIHHVEENLEITTEELHEELQQNIDALTITEQTLQARINHLEYLDNELGVAILKNEILVYMNTSFAKKANLNKKAIAISELMDDDSQLKLISTVNEETLTTFKSTINNKEVTIDVRPLENEGEAIVMIH